MSLGFLSVGGRAAARSPLLDAASAAGARVEERDGWDVLVSHGDVEAEIAASVETVGFADLSHTGKLELQAPPALLERLLGAAELGRARPQEGHWHCPVTPSRALLLARAEGGSVPEIEKLEAAGARVCDLTGSLASVVVLGPRSRDLFARFCALDLRPAVLPAGGFRPGSVARTPAYVLREGEDRFRLVFGAAFGEYFWEVLSDAAGALGGRPIGLDALQAAELAAQDRQLLEGAVGDRA